MAASTLPPTARRFVAATCFAAFAFLFTVIFFLRLSMAPHAIILYIVLPSVSAAIAGYSWGGPLLDSSHVKTHGQAMLRGLGITVGAYAIFAVLYASWLPLLEGEWSLARVGSLVVFVLAFGPLLVGPLAAIIGIFAAIILYRFGRRIMAWRPMD